ncbi:MAG: ATP-binding cassette domain-containing protein [Planctomycetes bacterium]|nr:ATP-binding cassette domain-containing protein [Planctomycetota bacterium]
MPVVSATNLRITLGAKTVLDGATFAIEPGERVGLVGRNGCGKSTLLKILCGKLKPEGGEVSLLRGARLGYLEQEPRFDLSLTLQTAAAQGLSSGTNARAELDHVFEEMATAQGDALEKLFERQIALEAKIEQSGGWSSDHLVEAVLHGLGFTDEQFDIPVKGLSGGQKARLGLARLLLEEPDALLLDEPTNHLDIVGREWLETFLADTFQGAVVIISHDRRLLDKVVHRIEEIHEGTTRSYPGNYHAFVDLRRERHLSQMRVHEKQLDKIRSEEQFILRYKAGQRAKQARGRATRLERFKEDNLVERPIELDSMRLSLPKGPRIGDSVAVCEDLQKTLGDRLLFKELTITIKPGDRIGIIGPNGAGKTTLIRTLLGEIPFDKGTVRQSPKLHPGWFKQTHEHLDYTLNVWQYLQRTVPARPGLGKLNEQESRDLAGAFLFSGYEQEKLLGEVSGGERARAVLAGLVAGGHNLLVLDEPTNHLDIPSAERLEEALSLDPDDGGYDGALLLVSHDRALLAATCDRLIILDGHGNATVFDGNYDEWVAKQAAKAKLEATPAQKSSTTSAKSHGKDKPASKDSANPKSGTKSKTKSAPDPFAKLSIEDLENQTRKLAADILALDNTIALPETARNHKKLATLLDDREKLVARLHATEQSWLQRADHS